MDEAKGRWVGRVDLGLNFGFRLLIIEVQIEVEEGEVVVLG